MQQVGQSVAQSIYKHNIPGYAFVDTDIQIVLNALEQRDKNNLNSDVIITAPVSQEDNTLTTLLKDVQ